MANTNQLSENALDLIINFEVGGGKSYYNKFLQAPEWPGGQSGVTIGIGVDLGYDAEVISYLNGKIPAEQLNRLARCVGLTGTRARAALGNVRDIRISWDIAIDYFQNYTLPKYIEETLEAFPNSDQLPDDAFGALVSLVFNRGPLIDNSDRRREMREIRRILLLGNDEEVDNDDILAIAAQVRSMARLWADTASDADLHDRRIAEAELIENSIK